MKSEIRNPKLEIRIGSSWLIFLLLCAHLIFCHGCHGEDVDDELCVSPHAAPSKEEIHRGERGERREINEKFETLNPYITEQD
ncbi:MAG: hypothetical protein ACYC3I_22035 [Gemmataceae bacterium]